MIGLEWIVVLILASWAFLIFLAFLVVLSLFEVFWRWVWGGHDDKYPRESDTNPMVQFSDDELVMMAGGIVSSEQLFKIDEWYARHGDLHDEFVEDMNRRRDQWTEDE